MKLRTDIPEPTFGNLGRNVYRGPYQQNWDFSLMKNFQLTERFTLRFGTDFFNIWNHANFANPAVTDNVEMARAALRMQNDMILRPCQKSHRVFHN